MLISSSGLVVTDFIPIAVTGFGFGEVGSDRSRPVTTGATEGSWKVSVVAGLADPESAITESSAQELAVPELVVTGRDLSLPKLTAYRF